MAPVLGRAFCAPGDGLTHCLASYEQFLFVWLGSPLSATLASRPEHAMSPVAAACLLPDGSRLSEGSSTGGGADTCRCVAGALTCTAAPTERPAALRQPGTCKLPPSLTALSQVRVPEGVTLDDGCTRLVCTDGAWVGTHPVCDAAKVTRVLPMGRSETGLVRTELLVLDRPSRAAGATHPKGLIGASSVQLRFVNVSDSPVVLTTGDLLRWRFLPVGPVAAAPVQASLEQNLVVGRPVTLEPGGFLEVAMPWLINGDRANPAPFAWSRPGSFVLVFSGTVRVASAGQNEACDFASMATPAEVTP
jgi:hypothetical protein